MRRRICNMAVAALMAASAFPLSVMGGDLKAPFELESTKVLPENVRNPRFKSIYMSVANKFDGVGQTQELGFKLNKVVSWQDIKDAQSSIEKKTVIDGVLKDPYSDGNTTSPAIDPNGSPGATTGKVQTFANVMVPVLAYGVTDRLTMAVAVPVMSVSISADTGFTASADGRTFINGACSKSSIYDCAENAAKLNDAVNQKLTRLGYQPIQSRSFTAIGDAKLVGKYLVYSGDRDAVALKGELTAPTGVKPDPDKALDVPTGDGQWDLGVGGIYDRQLFRRLGFNAFAGYTWQTPDSLVKRLPTSATDSLSADKELLDRRLGDIVSLGTSLNYEIPAAGMMLGAGYGYQFLMRTQYSRGIYPEYRYERLEAEAPSQAMHSMTLSAGFSTVNWYKQGKFVLPFQANLDYSKPIAGRNVTDNSLINAELVAFF
jgi:hypothetical protein